MSDRVVKKAQQIFNSMGMTLDLIDELKPFLEEDRNNRAQMEEAEESCDCVSSNLEGLDTLTTGLRETLRLFASTLQSSMNHIRHHDQHQEAAKNLAKMIKEKTGMDVDTHDVGIPIPIAVAPPPFPVAPEDDEPETH